MAASTGQAGQQAGKTVRRVLPDGYALLEMTEEGRRYFVPARVVPTVDGSLPLRYFPARHPEQTLCVYTRYTRRERALAFICDYNACRTRSARSTRLGRAQGPVPPQPHVHRDAARQAPAGAS